MPKARMRIESNDGLEKLAEAIFAIWRPRQTGHSNGCWCPFFYLRNATTKFSSSGTCFTVSFTRYLVKLLLVCPRTINGA